MSQHVKEADGTSGQDTNTGSGIKTGHIQDGAITPSKMGFYKNVIVVAPSGGDFTSPVDAMNAITDASASNPYLVKIMPGSFNIGANSVQMKEYVDIEGSGENITVIEGSAYNVLSGASNSELRFLTINSTCQYSGGGNSLRAVNSPAKITHVTVKVTKTCGLGGIAISAGGTTLTDVTATITGTDGDNAAIGTDGSITMKNVTATASGPGWAYGVKNGAGSIVIMNNVTAEASGGIGGSGVAGDRSSSITMINVTAKGSHYGIVNENSTFHVECSTIVGPNQTAHAYNGYNYIGNSKLDGGPASGTCAGVYDENYTFYTNTCP
ncbi:MAG: hypothetical protein HY754_09315 [Nitrospirae bacterium]|nr:hypothetical protein [Nitrospirota bacterium]